MSRLVCGLGVMLYALSGALSAQGWTISWTQLNATPTEAQGYVYRLSVDGGAMTVVPTVCAAVGSVTECSTPRPPLGSGPHTLTLTAENGFGVSAPATISGQPPMSPATIKVTIEITVP